MEDFTLQAAKVIEPPKAAVEQARVEHNTAGMGVIVMHKNLPAHRSCTKSKAGKQLTMADTATNCGGKHCVTCKGKMEGCQMMDT
eukprot:9574631-Heterocapsa_arctica.AAC.1